MVDGGLVGSGRRGCIEVGRTARVGQAARGQVVIYRSVTLLVGRCRGVLACTVRAWWVGASLVGSAPASGRGVPD